MRNDIIELLNKYIESAIIHGEATYAGDYKKANKNVKKLSKIYKIMESDEVLADNMLTELFTNENVNVRIWSTAHALGLKIKIIEAERLLKDISMKDDIGILSFDAEMTLKTWKNQGFLKFY